MILLLLLSLLFAGAAAGPVQFIEASLERFECGPSGIVPLTWAAQKGISHCIEHVQDRVNLCCKEHDLCYSLHSLTGKTRQECDTRFCNCLQDAQDRTKNYGCASPLNGFCNAVLDLGGWSFESAKPDIHEGKLDRFVDHKPLGLDMQKLVDTCHYSKLVAEHCHDSVHKCLQSPHVFKHKRFSIVGNPYQDCHSNMYYCLQVIVENEVDDHCKSLARNMTEEVNVYAKLDENTHGKAVIENYHIIMGRLVEQCVQSEASIRNCSIAFDKCAVNNTEERTENYGPARKIKIVCHRELNGCILEATKTETAERCVEARNVAKGIIREMELQPEASRWEKLGSYVSTGATTILNIGKDVKDAAFEKGAQAVDMAGRVLDAGKEAVGGAIDTMTGLWNKYGWGR